MPDELEKPDGEGGFGPIKSFLGHLEDLRWVLVKSAVVVAIAWMGCFYFSPEILDLLKKPLVWSGVTEPDKFLRLFGPMDSFSVSFQIALWGGLVFSTPCILFFVGEFFLPALTGRERKLVMPALLVGTTCFLGGVFFCYFFILPSTLRLSREFAEWLHVSVDFWTLDSYISFITKFMLGMGLGFESPLVIMILVKMGLLDYKKLAGARRHVIVINLILAAIITPTQDVFNLMVMALPLIFLYEACVWITWLLERRKKKSYEE